MEPPGSKFLMGTDELGRDILSRVLQGLRLSLLIGLVSAGISTLIGILFGAVSGFFGRWIDDLLMRITEIFQVIPRFFLTMMLVAFFGPDLINIVFAIALLSWPQLARLVRAEFLALKSRQFVDAARTAGASTGALIFLEILPNSLGPLIVNSTLLVGQAVLQEAGLSFIGLGDPTQVSLGVMLYQAQDIMRTAWWATAFPGLFIFLAVLSVNLIGDGLNDLFNPRSRER
jgi:peptide/nickel transport system permease protein